MIEYLNDKYHNIVQQEIQNLNKLTDKNIENIVNKIPDDLLTDVHKAYIIQYLKKRRNRLLEIVWMGWKNDKRTVVNLERANK